MITENTTIDHLRNECRERIKNDDSSTQSDKYSNRFVIWWPRNKVFICFSISFSIAYSLSVSLSLFFCFSISFSVSFSLSRSLSLSLSRSLSLTLSISHPLTHSLTHLLNVRTVGGSDSMDPKKHQSETLGPDGTIVTAAAVEGACCWFCKP